MGTVKKIGALVCFEQCTINKLFFTTKIMDIAVLLKRFLKKRMEEIDLYWHLIYQGPHLNHLVPLFCPVYCVLF